VHNLVFIHPFFSAISFVQCRTCCLFLDCLPLFHQVAPNSTSLDSTYHVSLTQITVFIDI